MLTKGQSTFMVEMTETANILHNMSARSLVLLDEIGRGTSTYDGMSLAWAVIEYLHNHGDLRPRTLFATHYHELTTLQASLSRVQNYNAAVHESGEEIVFLRKILPGGANRSYGIHVARLAGLPGTVVQRAQALLTQFESPASPATAPATKPKPQQASPAQPSLFDGAMIRLLDDLRTISIETLSPLEALNTLADLQQRAQRLP
jgi:DNA mismatch repair protein MutS